LYSSLADINKDKKTVLNFLNHWNAVLENGAYHEYTAFYDHEFLPEIAAWWPEWDQNRKVFNARHSSFWVGLENISIFKHNGIFFVTLNRIISCSGMKSKSQTKKIFLTHKGQQLKIIGEEYPFIHNNDSDMYPLIAACGNLKMMFAAKMEIKKMLAGWLKAWSLKDIESFGSYYAKDFRSSKNSNLKSWLKHKKYLNRKYSYINVTMKNPTINIDNKTSTITFLQTYESDAYKAVGIKKLVLKLDNGEWKIYRETWKKCL